MLCSDERLETPGASMRRARCPCRFRCAWLPSMAVSPVVRVPVKQDGHSHGVRERLARCWDGDSGFWLPIACSVVRQTRRARFKLWAWALQAHRLLGEDVSSSFLVASAGQRSVFTTICEGVRDESEHSSRARGSWSPSRSTGRRMGSGRARKGGASGVSRTAYQRAVSLSLYRLAHRRAQSRGLPFFSDDVTFERKMHPDLACFLSSCTPALSRFSINLHLF